MARLNNEQVGISAEVAIADVFGVSISSSYRLRSVSEIVESLKDITINAFQENAIERPVRHVAEGQNPVDFVLEGSKTLSVKSNKQGLGRVAPQRIGQPTSSTWFTILRQNTTILNGVETPNSLDEKRRVFKNIALSRIDDLLDYYWANMFDCDYYFHVYDVVDCDDRPTSRPRVLVLKKMESPKWDKSKITFTKSTVDEWNESSTVKYNNVSIGEFQIHNNRDNFKFRFNMGGIAKLIEENLITVS